MQSGIAGDMFLFASYHRAKWSGTPVLVDVASAAGGLVDPKIDETFDVSEKFSIGVGRKFSERLSGSLSYSNEEGSGADAESFLHSLTAQKPSVRVCAIQSITWTFLSVYHGAHWAMLQLMVVCLTETLYTKETLSPRWA